VQVIRLGIVVVVEGNGDGRASTADPSYEMNGFPISHRSLIRPARAEPGRPELRVAWREGNSQSTIATQAMGH
jgi:hypothetical protein